MADKDSSAFTWFALCDVDQLGERAIYRTELHGNELVVWRAEDGAVNVWENRCPHRGVRLSIGHHRGDALQCQYHGWQFGSGDGGCRFVPAHPDGAAPPVAVKTWPVEVRHGFVWTCLAQPEEAPPFAPLDELEDDGQQVRLRTVAIDACADDVQRALSAYCFDHADFDAWRTTDCVAFHLSTHAVLIEQPDDAAQRVVFLTQPARAGRTYLHGIALGAFAGEERLAVQRHHQQRLNALRDALEQPAARDEHLSRDRFADRPPPVMPHAQPSTQPVFLSPAMARAVSTEAASASGTDDHATDHAFTVHLARSDRTLNVPAGVSLLQTLREHRIDVPTSCEQGVCGTCRTRVLDGTPLHRDAFLTPQERAEGNCMMVCVSRACGVALTLDL
jgi:vanillate O-demethylase ferredoxin subunit